MLGYVLKIIVIIPTIIQNTTVFIYDCAVMGTVLTNVVNISTSFELIIELKLIICLKH